MKTEIDRSCDPDDDLRATQILDDRVLKDVVAYVEVRSTNDNRSQAICRELEALGARVSKKFTDDVTHVIYKEGGKRTRNKAQKRGVPLVSVLWIESCKHNQSHVSERLYPALLQENKGTPILLTKLKKAKSMQPRNFEDDLASSAERCLKKRRKGELDRLKSNENTPKFSPRPILALDTQHLSPEGFVHTPVRLTIPDTPLSMREKMERLKQTRINAGSYTSPIDDEIQSSGEREPLQRQLFDTSNYSVSSIETERQASMLSQNFSSTECEEDPVPADVREKLETIKNHGNKDYQRESHGTTKSPLQHLSPSQCISEPTKRKSLGSEHSRNVSTPSVIKRSLNKCTEDMNTNDMIDKCSHAVDVAIYRCNENGEGGNKCKEENNESASQPNFTENKKTLKKKLLSVKDTVIPPSILIEPTKCSQYPSPALTNIIVKARQGRARGNSSTFVDTGAMTRDERYKETGKNGGRKRKSKLVGEDDNDSSSERSNKKQRHNSNLEKSVACGSKEAVACGSKEAVACGSKEAVACGSKEAYSGKSEYDTISVQKEIEIIQPNITHNITMTNHNSFLNSTQETTIGLSVSTRETTLGLSMSTAYTDTTMPSILMPPRPSIDEFNPKRNKLRGIKQPFTHKNTENENPLGSYTSHNSDWGKCENEVVCERSSQTKMQDSSFSSIKRPTLVMTSLHSHEQDVVIAVVKKLGGFSITDKVCETTTHVVSGEPRRTLNILHGLSRGCWVICKDWVLQSLEAGRWLKEDAFECYNDFPACRITRDTRERGLPISARKLFAELGHIFISNKTVPPRNHLIPLIKVCGGQVTSNFSKARLYLGSDFHPDIISLKPLWILDCVTESKLLPMDRYTSDKPKRENSPVY